MRIYIYIYIYIGGFEVENNLDGRLKNGKIPGCERAKMRLPQREDMGDHDSPFYIAHTIMVFFGKITHITPSLTKNDWPTFF